MNAVRPTGSVPFGRRTGVLLLTALLTAVVLGGFSGLGAAVGGAAELNPPSSQLQRIFAGGVPEAVAELKAMEGHVRKLVEKVTPSTVGIRVGPAHGSGVIISSDGYVLTAAHVIGQPGQNARVYLPDGRLVKGTTLGVDRTMDAGLLKITEPQEADWPHLEMGDSADLEPGQWCLALGHPGGYESDRNPVVRLGRVLANQKTWAITTDCTLIGGDSGGPLLDMRGRVIGVHSRIGNSLSHNMHIPIQTYTQTWDRLVAGEAWGHLPGHAPFIGVQGEVESPQAKIARVFPDTPAEKAGIQEGDVITKFAGEPVTDFDSLRAHVDAHMPGDRVKVTLQRGEQTRELELVIGRRSG